MGRGQAGQKESGPVASRRYASVVVPSTEIILPKPRAPIVIEGDLSTEIFDAIRRERNPRVSWDTETDGLDWQENRLDLVQVSFAGQPMIIQNMRAKPPNLSMLLSDPQVLKIFHYAPFDLRFMRHEWGAAPRNVMCTKVMSKLLHREEDFKHSLGPLLEHYFGIKLDKDPSVRVSDWSAPDLSERQLLYAANDVLYLEPLAEQMKAELIEQGLWGLARRCFEHLPTRVELEVGGYGDVFTY